MFTVGLDNEGAGFMLVWGDDVERLMVSVRLTLIYYLKVSSYKEEALIALLSYAIVFLLIHLLSN
jgi:hypothetical protein